MASYFTYKWRQDTGWVSSGWLSQKQACLYTEPSSGGWYDWFAIYSSNPFGMLNNSLLDWYQASNALCYGSYPAMTVGSGGGMQTRTPGWDSSMQLIASAPPPSPPRPSPGPPPPP